jgi:hypothetical protein
MTAVAEASRAARLLLPNHYPYLGNFLEGPDQPLFMEHVDNDIALYKNFHAFLLTAEGIPIVYYLGLQGASGTDQRAPAWQATPSSSSSSLDGLPYGIGSDLHAFFKALLQQRKEVQLWKYRQEEVYVDESYLVLARGPVLLVINNLQKEDEGRAVPKQIAARTGVHQLYGQMLVDLFSPRVGCLILHGPQALTKL